jgi:peptidylprolyl isomerase
MNKALITITLTRHICIIGLRRKLSRIWECHCSRTAASVGYSNGEENSVQINIRRLVSTSKLSSHAKSADGTFIDSSIGKEPLQFTIGQFQLLPKLEAALVGMFPGESKTVYIASDEAFGQYDAQLVEVISRKKFPPTISLEVGKQVEIRNKERTTLVTVTEIDELTVTLDANHPLAGKDLIFDLEIIENS